MCSFRHYMGYDYLASFVLFVLFFLQYAFVLRLILARSSSENSFFHSVLSYLSSDKAFTFTVFVLNTFLFPIPSSLILSPIVFSYSLAGERTIRLQRWLLRQISCHALLARRLVYYRFWFTLLRVHRKLFFSSLWPRSIKSFHITLGFV